MTSNPWALTIHSFSVIVKHEAIIHRFDGGVAEFERVFSPPRKNGALCLVVCRSLPDAEQVRGLLIASGLEPGHDFAVADMMHGPLEPHPGFQFDCAGEFPGIRWTVALHEGDTDEHQSFVRPEDFPAKSYHFTYDEAGRQSLLVKFEKEHDEPRRDEGPRRAMRDEGPLNDPDSAPSNLSAPQSLEDRHATHTIRIQYTTGLMASHDCWEAAGEVEIDVDGSALSIIRSGAEIEMEPIAVRPKRSNPDLQWSSFSWRFNDPKPGNCTIMMPVEDDETDWLEGVSIWIDGEEQPAPPRYWDE